jgi:hypothetical protein
MCRCAGVQVYRSTGVQVYRSTGLQLCSSGVGVHACRCAGVDASTGTRRAGSGAVDGPACALLHCPFPLSLSIY